MDLLGKLKDRQAVVAVIGLGYVGLPLALAFAEAGFRVIGIDVNEGRVEAINRGESYVEDIPSPTLARYVQDGAPDAQMASGSAGRSLRATTDFDALGQADAIVICVPTPLDKTKDPDMSYIINVADEIARRLHPGMLVVLESTTYPGTTEEVILGRLQEDDGRHLTVGEDFYLAFSPERIDPGRKDWTIHNTPKVIGGVTPRCLEAASTLYGAAIQRIIPVSSPRVAEMVKLLENTFRAVNIGLVNEVAIMCDRLGVDVWEVVEAAKTKPFGFMPFYPGPGLGGHCIPIDPQYLAWKLKTLNYNARFIHLAAEINFGMPHYILGKITDALNDEGKAVKGARTLVLGVAYKAEVSDLRESPALDLIHLLTQKGAVVSYHDPYVPYLNADGLALESVTLDADTLEQADCVVIATAHQAYDWAWVVSHSRLIVDTRNATRAVRQSATRLVTL